MRVALRVRRFGVVTYRVTYRVTYPGAEPDALRLLEYSTTSSWRDHRRMQRAVLVLVVAGQPGVAFLIEADAGFSIGVGAHVVLNPLQRRESSPKIEIWQR